MNADPLQDRINELEARLEFQDETIARLNDELIEQQKRIFKFDKSLKLMARHLQSKDFDPTEPLTDPRDEPPPPHY